VYLSRQVPAQLRAHIPPRREGRTKGSETGLIHLGAFRNAVLTEQAGSQGTQDFCKLLGLARSAPSIASG